MFGAVSLKNNSSNISLWDQECSTLNKPGLFDLPVAAGHPWRRDPGGGCRPGRSRCFPPRPRPHSRGSGPAARWGYWPAASVQFPENISVQYHGNILLFWFLTIICLSKFVFLNLSFHFELVGRFFSCDVDFSPSLSSSPGRGK